MQRTRQPESLNTQMRRRVESKKEVREEYDDGNFGNVISTGSTLADLAISGGRFRGGGIPSGIFVELFGPPGSGKTVLLCELAGAVQRLGGQVMFHDPEARLNPQFARMFDLKIEEMAYSCPDTVTQLFQAVEEWKPENPKVVNGIFADSLAALSTDLEMENKEGDKMGMRRPKEFSEGLRKTCRIIKDKNLLMVCSNQVRENIDAGPYGQKYNSPGGLSIKHYSSLSLRFAKPEKIKLKRKTLGGKEESRAIGVEVQIEVFKSSIWKPFHTAPVTILFDYGIDDIRANLQFVKDYTSNKIYTCKGIDLSNSLDKAIENVEDAELVEDLKEEVIDLWEENEKKFKQERKPKR